MADTNKFEQMLELLVNEDKEGAEALFHEIVVEKSRDIYESLLEDEAEIDEATDEEVDESSDEETNEASDEEVDEATDEEVDEAKDEEVDEGFDLDEFEVEADPMDDAGEDKTDDMMSDLGMDDEGEEGDDEPEGDVEDRVEDLEDALEDLKAEFEKMMGDEDAGDEEEMPDMDGEEGDEAEEEAVAFESSDEEVEEATDEEVDEASDEEVEEGEKSASETMREYVEKVSATMGDNGDNTKSPTASANNMGGTSANIAKGGEEKGGDHAGLGDSNAKEDSAGNVNVPGGKASKASKAQPGHGAEKKGKPEQAADKKSTLGS